MLHRALRHILPKVEWQDILSDCYGTILSRLHHEEPWLYSGAAVGLIATKRLPIFFSMQHGRVSKLAATRDRMEGDSVGVNSKSVALRARVSRLMLGCQWCAKQRKRRRKEWVLRCVGSYAAKLDSMRHLRMI